MSLSIQRLDLLISNAFLVTDGGRTILIDTGASLFYSRLRGLLEKHGCRPGGIDLVIITHAHPDHAGNAARLQHEFGASIAIHAAEENWLRTGSTELYRPCGVAGHLLSQIIPRTFDPCVPDRVFEGDEHLPLTNSHALRLVHTPGHTPGHLCVDAGSDGLFAGDLMRGGLVRRDFVGEPFFLQDRQALRKSVETVRSLSPGHLFFGHGRAASREAFMKSAVGA